MSCDPTCGCNETRLQLLNTCPHMSQALLDRSLAQADCSSRYTSAKLPDNLTIYIPENSSIHTRQRACTRPAACITVGHLVSQPLLSVIDAARSLLPRVHGCSQRSNLLFISDTSSTPCPLELSAPIRSPFLLLRPSSC